MDEDKNTIFLHCISFKCNFWIFWGLRRRIPALPHKPSATGTASAPRFAISGQARALGISRGSVYYLPRSVSAADLVLMRRIDELHLDYPFAGSRMLQGLLLAEGHKTGRLHVATLMKRMGVMAIYRRPNTSKPEPRHKIFPYLLRKLPVTGANQV